jgi:hypothetical protein
MYPVTLALHSWLRWLVLAAGVLAVLRALAGLFGPRPWTPADDKAGRWFTLTLDVQTLLGLLLYGVLSPVTRNALADMGAAMGTASLRFWAVEHVFAMLLAVVLAHIGRARARRPSAAARKHRTALIFLGAAVLLVLAGMPWPWSSADPRPLVRLP